jgi:predicted 3-demethylubiquinone-9 3-methyltransferase (glyoxalase superfamily)
MYPVMQLGRFLKNRPMKAENFRAMVEWDPFRSTKVSFLVACAARDEIDDMWDGLSSGGAALMELGAYPFSRRYGWVQDRYGLSWQIMFTEGRPIEQNITPVLMFAGQARGKAQEAIDFYTSTFRNARIGDIARYSRDAAPDREGSIQFAWFALEGQWFAAMDSARAHDAAFNEAISFMVNCETRQSWMTIGTNSPRCRKQSNAAG